MTIVNLKLIPEIIQLLKQNISILMEIYNSKFILTGIFAFIVIHN